jgi:hypothetical protein
LPREIDNDLLPAVFFMIFIALVLAVFLQASRG